MLTLWSRQAHLTMHAVLLHRIRLVGVRAGVSLRSRSRARVGGGCGQSLGSLGGREELVRIFQLQRVAQHLVHVVRRMEFEGTGHLSGHLFQIFRILLGNDDFRDLGPMRNQGCRRN